MNKLNKLFTHIQHPVGTKATNQESCKILWQKDSFIYYFSLLCQFHYPGYIFQCSIRRLLVCVVFLSYCSIKVLPIFLSRLSLSFRSCRRQDGHHHTYISVFLQWNTCFCWYFFYVIFHISCYSFSGVWQSAYSCLKQLYFHITFCTNLHLIIMGSTYWVLR